MNNIYKRIAVAEALAEAQKDEQIDRMKAAYAKACDQHETEEAARLARKIRNKLLADSDSQMTLDRFGLVVPTGITFTAWLQFFKDLGKIINGDWAQYRKALRELPEQAGFPFDVEFPKSPENKNK